MSGFEEAIRRELDTSASTDPAVIAKSVVATLTDAECREVLEGPVGRRVVMDEIRCRTNHAFATAQRPDTEPAPSTSTRWAGAAKSAADPLNQRVSVPERGIMFLRDCRRADLLAMANHRHELARQNTLAAERLERLAALLPNERKQLGEVPAAKIRQALA